MPCFVHYFPFRQFKNYWNRLKFDRVVITCNTATFYEPRQKCSFWFFQVRCARKSGDVINFIIVACRIASWLKWYKNCKNWLRFAKFMIKNKMSRFLWFTVYILNVVVKQEILIKTQVNQNRQRIVVLHTTEFHSLHATVYVCTYSYAWVKT